MTSVTSIVNATTAGDPPVPACQSYISRSIWYTFRPAVTGSYTIATCGGATTMEDNVLALYASANGCAGPFTQLTGGCDDDGCGGGTLLARITRRLSQDTTYFAVVWKYSPGVPAAGRTDLQLTITRNDPPANDLCANAVPLLLNRPVAGTTVWAANNYQLSGQSCFTGLQQNASIAAGGDVVYTFTAPVADTYSFRVSQYSAMSDLVVYVAGSCPAGASPAIVTGCLGAANRSTQGSAEEVVSVPLAANQQVFVFVDEHAPSAGSSFVVEAALCRREIEPNNAPASAGALVQGLTGAITPNGEADFYSLGTPPAGSRVFAMVDGSAGSTTDLDLRVTTATDVLEYDDADNDTPFGSASPNIAGRALTGVPSFLRVNAFSPGDVTEPYKLYAVVQPPLAAAAGESEPNDTRENASQSVGNYFIGTLGGAAPSTDVDWYGFVAQAGEQIQIGLDGDPLRDNTPLNAALALTDANGVVLVSVNDGDAASSNASGAGSLTATTPRSPGEAIVWHAPASGAYYVRVSAGSTSTGATAAGDYLLSIGKNGMAGGGGLPADIAVSLAGPDTAAAGYTVTYAVTVTNNGSANATGLTVIDSLQPGTTFLSITSTGVCSTPAVGATGLITCTYASLPRGASVTSTIRAFVTAPPGATISNLARAYAEQPDMNLANNAATRTSPVASQAADLAVTMLSTQDSVIAGTAWICTATVSNLGPTTAQSVIVTDTLPAGTSFQSISVPSGWTATTPAVGAPGVVTITRPSLGAGASGAITMVVMLSPTIPNLAQPVHCLAASSMVLDPDKLNNRGCATTTASNRPPRIEVPGSTAVVSFGCMYPKERASSVRDVLITNANTAYNAADMQWSATTTAPEISLTTASGSEGGRLTFTVRSSGLPAGTHVRTITITATDGRTGVPAENSPFVLTVRIEVQPMPAQVVSQTRAIGAAWTPFTNALGQVFAEVRSNAGADTAFTVTMHPCDLPEGIARMQYAARYYTLSSSSSTPSVDVRFRYTGNELVQLMVSNPSLLRGWRQYPAAGVWYPTVSTSDPLTSSVTVTGITDVRDVWMMAAPYALVQMRARGTAARLRDGAILLRWETGVQPQGGAFVVERRTDASSAWVPVATVPVRAQALQSEGVCELVERDADLPRTAAYRIFGVDAQGTGLLSDPVTPGDGPLIDAVDAPVAAGIRLDQNVPNPLVLPQGTATHIGYEIPADAHVTLTVYDASGRSVRTIVDRVERAGRHVAEFDAAGLPAGTYHYRLQAGVEAVTRTMTVLR